MLVHELEQQGHWLFRRRSYIPLVLLPFALLALSTHRRHLFGSTAAELFYDLACLLVSLAGTGIRMAALGYAQPGSSGRNTREQIAEHLNTSGPYSLCRHPLYLGNIVIMLGVALFTKSPLFVFCAVLAYLLLYERIIAAEEGFLVEKYGATFRRWAAHTPALLPRFSKWTRPEQPFSLRAAVKGEFYGFTAVVVVMFVLKTADVWFVERRIRADIFWLTLLGASLLMFVVLRFVRKHTRFFEPRERRSAA